MKWTQIELPSLHLLWKRGNKEEIVSSVIRTNYPKPSLCYIPPIIQQTGLCEVDSIDMKIRDQDTIVPYKKFRYEDGIMIASRMGTSFEKVEEKLKETDILGLSINPTSWSDIAKDFMRYARTINPKIKIVIGGNEAIFRSDKYLKNGLADIAITGEGENTIPDLIRALRGEIGLGDVKGIAFGKTRTENAPKPQMEDIPLPALDLLNEDIPLWTTPIEYFPLPKGVNTPIGWLFTSRGCYQDCEYCTTPKKMGRFRFSSLERIAKELDHLKKHGINTLNIWDDSLSSIMYPGALGREQGREHIINLARMLKEKGFAYELSQGGLVIKDLWNLDNDQPDYELIQEFFSNRVVGDRFIGFYGQYFPTECLQIENPSERYPKLMTFEKEKEVLKVILNAGDIKPAISYSSIIGTSEDTQEGFNLACKRLRELNRRVSLEGGKYLATPFIHSIFPGTRLWAQYEKRLVYPINRFPELYQFHTAPHATEKFTPLGLTLAKKDMERQLMSPEQLERWNATGRYQWG